MLYFQILATDFCVTTEHQRKGIENASTFIFWQPDSEDFCWRQMFLTFLHRSVDGLQGRYNGLDHMFFPLQSLFILTDHQHFIFKDKSGFDMEKKIRIGTKNHFSVLTTIPFRLFSRDS